MSYVDEYIHKQLGLKDDDKGFNIELINGRLKEIFDCVDHLERIRNNYACEVMQEWSQRLSADFPECKKVEFIKPENIVNTGITIPFGGVPDAIAIRIQYEKGKLYYGLACMPATREKRAELQEAMSFVNTNGDFIKGSDWLYYKYTSFKDGYEELKNLAKRLVDYINNIPLAVRKRAPFLGEIIFLGEYKGKKVYGYAPVEDNGSGEGISHVMLFDGEKVEIAYEKDYHDLSPYFNL